SAAPSGSASLTSLYAAPLPFNEPVHYPEAHDPRRFAEHEERSEFRKSFSRTVTSSSISISLKPSLFSYPTRQNPGKRRARSRLEEWRRGRQGPFPDQNTIEKRSMQGVMIRLFAGRPISSTEAEKARARSVSCFQAFANFLILGSILGCASSESTAQKALRRGPLPYHVGIFVESASKSPASDGANAEGMTDKESPA